MNVQVQVQVHTSVVSCGRSRSGNIFTLVVCVLVVATRVARLEQVGHLGERRYFGARMAGGFDGDGGGGFHCIRDLPCLPSHYASRLRARALDHYLLGRI
jgi:hypothetical protein